MIYGDKPGRQQGALLGRPWLRPKGWEDMYVVGLQPGVHASGILLDMWK